MSFYKKLILLLCLPSMCSAHTILCVSLGMPKHTLRDYFKQAASYHIPIVIRGLYSKKPSSIGSVKDTVARLKQLVGKRQGISIDPLYFREFKIKAVPALVIYQDKQRDDMVLGNIPLAQSLHLIIQHAKYSANAQEALQHLKQGDT